VIDDRVGPSAIGDERQVLREFLDYQRATLAMKCQDLSDDELRRTAGPTSSLSLLGLVRHMAEVEAWWFRTNLTGVPAHGFYALDGDEDFDDLDTVPAEEVFARFRSECELADAAAADLPLETTFRTRRGRELDLRWVYLHMIEEYARHNGHADLLRERIDGVTGD